MSYPTYLPNIGNSLGDEIDEEVGKAYNKFPRPQASLHEGYAVLKEEVDELWDAVKDQKASPASIRKEAIQVAAMAIRFIKDGFNKQI